MRVTQVSWHATRRIEVPKVFGKSQAMDICKTFQVGASVVLDR
jgi:hypothetical protein